MGRKLWNISQEIDTYPITIYVDIISRLSPNCKGACNNTMEVHRFITDSQQLPDVNQKTGTFIGTISQQPSVTGTTSLTFTLGPTQDGFYLGIRSPGSCYTINGLTMYHLPREVSSPASWSGTLSRHTDSHKWTGPSRCYLCREC